jgi:uncharacterized protein DUF1844
MGEEYRDPEIKVTDRRRFSPEGDPLDDPVDPVETESEQAEPAPAAPPLPPASFEFLVISLRWQAEMQLGVFGPPEGEQRPDLDGARHSIDLLAVLQDKTKGNLTWEEQRLLENSLTELRFRFVQAVEQARQKP